MNNILLVSDGIPTLEKSIKYAYENRYKGNLIIISTKSKKLLKDRINLENIKLINIFRIKFNLDSIIKKTETIIFSDNASCPSTYFLIRFLLRKNIKCNFIFLKFVGLPYVQRNLLDYIFNPSNLRKNSILFPIRILIKIFFIYIYKIPVRFLSYENCKVSYIVPSYPELNNLQTIEIKPEFGVHKIINKNKFKRIIFLISPDEIKVLGESQFLKVISILGMILKLTNKRNLFIKQHPNHNCSKCLKFLIANLEKEYKVLILKNRFDFSEDLLISSTTSAIFTHNCLSAINLLGIFKNNKNKKDRNLNHLFAYQEANLKFFDKPKHIYNPKNIKEIESYFNKKFFSSFKKIK